MPSSWGGRVPGLVPRPPEDRAAFAAYIAAQPDFDISRVYSLAYYLRTPWHAYSGSMDASMCICAHACAHVRFDHASYLLLRTCRQVCASLRYSYS